MGIAALSSGDTVPPPSGKVWAIAHETPEDKLERADFGAAGNYVFGINKVGYDTSSVGEIDVCGYRPVRILADNAADEHVCSKEDFEWVPITPGVDPVLRVANAETLMYCGEKKVTLYVDYGRRMDITLQVLNVSGPIFSVGKFCSKSKERIS